MKIFYIISLALSSFFAYSAPLKASTMQYAFFIPSDSFQENINLNESTSTRRRQNKTGNTHPKDTTSNTSASNRKAAIPTSNSNTSAQQITPKKTKSRYTLPYVNNAIVENTASSQSSPKQSQKIHKKPQATATATKNIPHVKTNTPQPEPVAVSIPEMTEEIKTKLTQYRLDDDINSLPQKSDPPMPTLSRLEELNRKDINELIAMLPYPDFNLPKFKQLYALYGLELRVLLRRNKFSTNLEQEETLAKANSMRHFSVK